MGTAMIRPAERDLAPKTMQLKVSLVPASYEPAFPPAPPSVLYIPNSRFPPALSMPLVRSLFEGGTPNRCLRSGFASGSRRIRKLAHPRHISTIFLV